MSLQKELSEISKLPPAVQQLGLASLLSQLFAEENVMLTVVGGAAVQYYTDAEYVTKDIDAILFGDTKEIVDRVMGRAGFRRTTTYRHFEHPLFSFVVEFPPSPIAIASRHIDKVNLLKIGLQEVRVVRVEDLMMDRITAGVEWESERSLAQAKLLWIKNKKHIDRKYLTQFAKEEGYLKVLKQIMKL